jgi:hypothetical protein
MRGTTRTTRSAHRLHDHGLMTAPMNDDVPAPSARTPPPSRRDRMAGLLLLAVGVLTVGVAAYFLFLRPPMLPEDIRFTGVSADTLPPQLGDWLTIVFHTLGGFVGAVSSRGSGSSCSPAAHTG